MAEQEKDNTRYNFKHIYNNFYVVRTQAGLRRAIKHFLKGDPNEKMEVSVGKMTFPSVVAITWGRHAGIDNIIVSAVHVNRISAALVGE